MITMIDEIYDRNYRAGRDQLNTAILGLATRFGTAFGDAFRVLNRIEYSAPWASVSNRARCR
jgi:hypothetical protein